MLYGTVSLGPGGGKSQSVHWKARDDLRYFPNLVAVAGCLAG